MPPSQLAIEGAGHLASALIEGFSRAQIAPVSLHNRTPARALALAERFPCLQVFDQEPEFDADPCPLLLVIPGPAILALPAGRLEQLRGSGRVIVSCAGGLPLSVLEKTFPGLHWVKAIPSVSAAVGVSVTLMSTGAPPAIERIFAAVGTTVQIESDDEIDRLSVLTSCLPGILAAMLDELARTYGLDERQTRELLLESALGSILVAREKATNLSDLVATVANPGGLTETGVSVLRRGLRPLLAEMKLAMEARIRDRRRRYLEVGPR